MHTTAPSTTATSRTGYRTRLRQGEAALSFLHHPHGWAALVEHDPLATPYQSTAWLTAWARRLPAHAEPLIVTVTDQAGRDVAGLALMRDHHDDEPRITPLGSPTAQYTRPVGPAAETPAAAAALTHHLQRLHTDGHHIHINDVPAHSTLAHHLHAQPDWTHATTWSARLPLSADHVPLPHETRRSHRRHERARQRLEHDGHRLTYHRTTTHAELQDTWPLLRDLHHNLPRDTGRLQQILRSQRAAFIATMHLDGHPLAAHLCLARRHTAYSLLTATVSDHHGLTPDHALLHRLITDLTAHGYTALDLGRTPNAPAPRTDTPHNAAQISKLLTSTTPPVPEPTQSRRSVASPRNTTPPSSPATAPTRDLTIGTHRADAGADAAHLQAVIDRQRHIEYRAIGFPGNRATAFSQHAGLLDVLFNNVGDPTSPDASDVGTKPYEAEVIRFLAALFGARTREAYGYVTASGTAATEYGLFTARRLLPRAELYYSSAAHYSVPLLADKLRMPYVELPAGPNGILHPTVLRDAVAARPGRGAIVLATAGTTMTGAHDDPTALRRAAKEGGAGPVHVHTDGALGGLIAALTPGLPRVQFDAGTDSVSLSGHKLLGTPMPCGVVLTRTRHASPTATASYVAARNRTLDCSRNGTAALLLWAQLRQLGRSGLAQMIGRCLETAAYAHWRLHMLGYQPERQAHSPIVTFARPTTEICRRWRLPIERGRAHLVAMPHVTRVVIDDFLQDMEAEMSTATHTGWGAPA